MKSACQPLGRLLRCVRRSLVATVVGGCAAVSVGAADAAELSVRTTPGCVSTGEVVVVELVMSDLGTFFAAGFQATVQYDDQVLEFQEAAYTDEPFGLPLVVPVDDGGMIGLAAGINFGAGQEATNQDSVLAVLTFVALADEIGDAVVLPKNADIAPSISNLDGGVPDALALGPLVVTPPSADLDQDGEVDGADLGALLANWGRAGTGDLDCNGTVNGADLGALLAAWEL